MNDRFKFRVWGVCQEGFVEKSFDLVMLPSGKLCEYDGLEQNDPKYIVEQCTGIHDKHGNLIFEGDFVWDGEFEGVVVWKQSRWQVRFRLYDGDEGYEDLEQHFAECCEIHGNIHDGR